MFQFHVSRCLLCLGASSVLLTGSAPAQDRVHLISAGGGRIVVTGTVEEFNGKEVLLRPREGESPRRFPADEVLEVETTYPEAFSRGQSFFAEGRIDDASREFEAALAKEGRAWVRREILARLVQCAVRRADYAAAGARFLSIAKSDPALRHLRVIPLIWARETPGVQALISAQEWLHAGTDAARLMGASLLYDQPRHEAAVRGVLKDLSMSHDARIRLLAQFQTFRRDAYQGKPGPAELGFWQSRIDELPEELRGGPCYLLGQAYATRHEYERAAASFLWLPITCDFDGRLTARALLEAGEALEKLGQKHEARLLYQEAAARFPDTAAAKEAGSLIERGSADITRPAAERNSP